MSRKRTDNSKSNRFRKRIIDKVIMILVILVLMISSFLIFLTKKQTKSIKYTEAGNVDYNISLNKNDFFESTTLPSSNQYIAALIDNIDISYKYNLQMKDNYSNYKYKYRIESQTKVVEKTTQNNIYDFSETLKSEETVKPDKSKFDLNANISVNYAKYNEIVKKIISTYDLSNIESKTVITFYVDLLDEFLDEKRNIDEIIVYGHSCAIDFQYFSYLNIRYSNAYWKFYVRGAEQESNVRCLIEEYGINNANIVRV